MVVPDRVVQAERLVALPPLVTGARMLVDDQCGYAELPQPRAQRDAALSAADHEHIGLGGRPEVLGLLLPALLPGLALLVRTVFGTHRAVRAAWLLVALQLIHRRQQGPGAVLTVLADEPDQAHPAADGGLEAEPGGDHPVGLLRRLGGGETGGGGPLAGLGDQVRHLLPPLDGLQVPGERDQVAPVALGGEQVRGRRTVRGGQRLLEAGQPGVDAGLRVAGSPGVGLGVGGRIEGLGHAVPPWSVICGEGHITPRPQRG